MVSASAPANPERVLAPGKRRSRRPTDPMCMRVRVPVYVIHLACAHVCANACKRECCFHQRQAGVTRLLIVRRCRLHGVGVSPLALGRRDGKERRQSVCRSVNHGMTSHRNWRGARAARTAWT